ncbi:MAG: hypothetical protein H0T42_09385 [Deltaproteobacteria bacterium]|nr:hypothetical protein [Deltaproteobacteria bacterium]
MPSRLSSLLVRDGLVGVKRMEKAFQRQVIYGGSLDTILLEMNLVPEERLTQYLALASGLPPAGRAEGSKIEEAAIAVIPREVAEQYRAVPLAIDGETCRILVCSPLEITALEDLADQLDRPLQPLITPEYRWHLVYAAAYGLDPPARFTTLARSLDVDAIVAPVGRARTIIVDAVVRDDATPTGVVSGDITEKTELADLTSKMAAGPRQPPPPMPDEPPSPELWQTPPERSGPIARPSPLPPAPVGTPGSPAEALTPDSSASAAARDRRGTLVGVQPARARDTDPGAVFGPMRRPAGGAPAGALGRVALVATPSGGVPRVVIETNRESRPSGSMRALKNKRPDTAPIATEGRDTPLTIVAAREQLATSEDRDSVFLTMLRAARSRARWAGLLTVQGGAAIGRVALGEPGLDIAAVNTILIPLDTVSAFRAVVSNHQPHVGPLISGDPGIDSMILRMGGTMPPSALLLPIVLRERVVALVVAHRVHSDLRLSDVTELLPLANAVSEALGRLIVKHKSAGYRAPSAAPLVEIESEMVDTKRVARPGGPWSAPAEPPSVPGFDEGMEVAITTDPPRPIEVVIDEIESAAEGHTEDSLAEAVERAPESLVELGRRFPGKLHVDRFSVSGRALRAAQYGGLLELVIRLGSVASELLIEKMAAPQRDVRFYATVCTAELRPRTAVFALAERLFDQDFGVRACAIEALAGYPVSELATALVRARRAVHSSDPEVVGAAASAIVDLGDINAIPDLIGVIERNDRAGDHARRALVSLTAQDFGASERKWRKWYDSARTRHRIEWLIEGLAHKEDAIREAAIHDLRRLTGEYFGYHHDLPRRERDAAAARWSSWWNDAGRRRFIVREDERSRPTALLPARREPT